VADDQSRSDLPIDPSLLRMPRGYDATGDPVEGNPYPSTHPLHAFWARETRDAEEKVARLKSEWLSVQETEFSQPPQSVEEMVAFNERFWAKKRRVLCREFEIWAARGIQMVFSDADVRAMDKWLVDLADGYLELNATQMVQAGLPARLIEPRQRELRTDLGAVVLHCKAEARRICGLRQAEREAPEKVEPSQTKTPHNGDELSKRFQKRAQWLRQALESQRWTVQDFERFGGPKCQDNAKDARW
jgi:hypothetical protein